MTSRIPFTIHEFLRRARHRHDDPQFPIHTGTKHYARMPQISLTEPALPATSLAEALRERHSFPPKNASALRSPDIDDISNLLGSALRVRKDGTRPYPSGGGLYPIETYFVGSLDGAETPHAYHYDPRGHALEDLWIVPEDLDLEQVFSTPASSFIIFTGMWGRNGMKYGDFGYYLGMLEAGHMAQNILLAATAIGVTARPIGGFDDSKIAEVLDIDSNLEQVVYTIALGKIE